MSEFNSADCGKKLRKSSSHDRENRPRVVVMSFIDAMNVFIPRAKSVFFSFSFKLREIYLRAKLMDSRSLRNGKS